MPWRLGRHLCDSTCPGYLQPSASKGCNRFVAKCIQDFWGGKKLVLHPGYHNNSTWCFTGQENPGSHTSKVTPALQKRSQRLLDKAPPGQQPHFLHWIRLWATRSTWNRNWRLLLYVGFVKVLLLPLRGFAFLSLVQVDAEKMQRGVWREHKLLQAACCSESENEPFWGILCKERLPGSFIRGKSCNSMCLSFFTSPTPTLLC